MKSRSTDGGYSSIPAFSINMMRCSPRRPGTARTTASVHARRCLRRYIAWRSKPFRTIPRDPSTGWATRLENSTHWFRAKFFQQYRLFFRFHDSARIIVIAWVNDAGSKRAYGSKTGAYAVFAKMLARKRPPDDWNALLAECRKLERRSARARSAAKDAV
jgi:toxin YhaV